MQPFELPVTEYVVVNVGLTAITDPVALLLHVYELAPVALIEVVAFAHIVLFAAETASVGVLVTITRELVLQPNTL